MVLKMVGKGSQYLFSLRDSDGNLLIGENSYQLHLPANVPAANYWSIVMYDSDTRALLNSGQPFSSVASNQDITVNKDGSVDIYFGPTEPKVENTNWIKTVPGRGYMGGMRLFSPTQAYFDQTWRPDNIIKMKE